MPVAMATSSSRRRWCLRGSLIHRHLQEMFFNVAFIQINGLRSSGAIIKNSAQDRNLFDLNWSAYRISTKILSLLMDIDWLIMYDAGDPCTRSEIGYKSRM